MDRRFKMKKIIAIAILALTGSAAQADELLMTSSAAGRAQAVGIDYVSSGKAVAFDFKIRVEGGEKASVDLSKCMADLPKTHVGKCSFVNGTIIGLAYNDTNEPLPAGVFKVGSIGISGGGKPEVSYFLAADKDAVKIESSIRSDAAQK
jgi:hypothetical protein